MTAPDTYPDDDINPIDIVEHVAAYHQWDFDRIAEDQIVITREGQWRIYTITLDWSDYDEMLRLICHFDINPPAARMTALFESLNAVNDQCWTGVFTYWAEVKQMVYRYGLVLTGGNVASSEQILTMINCAVTSAERFYPAFQLVAWGNRDPKDALQVSIAEAYGRA